MKGWGDRGNAGKDKREGSREGAPDTQQMGCVRMEHTRAGEGGGGGVAGLHEERGVV
jgi:hypothetical protein